MSTLIRKLESHPRFKTLRARRKKGQPRARSEGRMSVLEMLQRNIFVTTPGGTGITTRAMKRRIDALSLSDGYIDLETAEREGWARRFDVRYHPNKGWRAERAPAEAA